MGIEAALHAILGKNAEPKTSQNGKAYLRLNVRVGDGATAQWVAVTTFDEEAIAMSAAFIKGAAVYVEGKLTLDRWTTAEGVQRAGLSLLSRYCRLSAIGRHKTKPRRSTASSTAAASPPSSAEAPAGTQPQIDFNDELPGWTP